MNKTAHDDAGQRLAQLQVLGFSDEADYEAHQQNLKGRVLLQQAHTLLVADGPWCLFNTRSDMDNEDADKGEQYRKMVQVAIDRQPGSQVGAALSVCYTQRKGGYEFFMWTGSAPAGRKCHSLLARETSQERLDAHWKGYVENNATNHRKTTS